MPTILRDAHISGLADSKMREAIGAICVHWSLLELMVERVIANLNGDSRAVTYKADLAHRLDDLKKAAKSLTPSLTPEKRNRISEISGFIKKVKEERHRAVHGLWCLDSSGNFKSLFPRDASGHMERDMDFVELRQIKLRIWQAHEALRPFADFSQAPVLSSPHKYAKQVPPRPVLLPDSQSKKNKHQTPQ